MLHCVIVTSIFLLTSQLECMCSSNSFNFFKFRFNLNQTHGVQQLQKMYSDPLVKAAIVQLKFTQLQVNLLDSKLFLIKLLSANVFKVSKYKYLCSRMVHV